MFFRYRGAIQKRKQQYAQSLKYAKQFSRLSSIQQVFVNMIDVEPDEKKKKGRRYTHMQKVLSLSILKKSPQCYRYQKSFLNLPSEAILHKV